MSYLFIDSTYDLCLGVLDGEFNWLAFERQKDQKASAIIQTRIYEILSSLNISVTSLSGIITANGPGFYTGLRLAEGLADVLKFFGVKHFSFYSYEIPLWCGIETGLWFTKAYRGEYFLYHWAQDTSSTELISAKEIESRLTKEETVYIHSDASLDEFGRSFIKKASPTFDLLRTMPQLIFKNVVNLKLQREAFYFRAPEDEFKANP